MEKISGTRGALGMKIKTSYERHCRLEYLLSLLESTLDILFPNLRLGELGAAEGAFHILASK
jgi:hypothetical protein